MAEGGVEKQESKQNSSGSTVGTCSECCKEPAVYKCPRCASTYCSVACCKGHKRKCNPETQPQSQVQSGIDELFSNFPFPTGAPVEALLKLRDDERVKSLLESPHLRVLVNKLNNSLNPNAEWLNMMNDPEFRALASVIIDVTGVRKNINTEEKGTS